MVFPLLVAILVGITEVGLYFKDYLTISYASREGARIGAFAGTAQDADCQILIGIGGILSEADLGRIDRIEIFRASAGGTQLETNVAAFDGDDPLSCHEPEEPEDGWNRGPTGWPSSARQTVVGSQPLDIIGVRLVMDRGWITGVPPFSGAVEIDEVTLTRLEPEAFHTP